MVNAVSFFLLFLHFIVLTILLLEKKYYKEVYREVNCRASPFTSLLYLYCVSQKHHKLK